MIASHTAWTNFYKIIVTILTSELSQVVFLVSYKINFHYQATLFIFHPNIDSIVVVINRQWCQQKITEKLFGYCTIHFSKATKPINIRLIITGSELYRKNYVSYYRLFSTNNQLNSLGLLLTKLVFSFHFNIREKLSFLRRLDGQSDTQ